MAQDSPGGENGQKQQKLSHKQRKALWRKEKRRKKRQEEARAREEELQAEQGTNEAPEKAEESDGERNIQEDEAEREGQHQLWLEREARAQEEFRVRREREEMKKRELEEQERLIREEWEEQQRKEKEAKERKEQQKKEQEDKLNKMLDSSSTSGNKKEEWHNPMAPADYSAGGEVPAPTGRAAEDCPFFQKTGACRFGDRCSRKHTRPDSSTTLLIAGMFATFALDQTQRDDFDETMYLEYGEDELYKDFIEFYNDTLPEFRTLGRVVQFKVCCNHEPHLRGNVYVQYEREEDCLEAIRKFHGRFYAGKQLTCEMTPVTSWKSAICGLFSRKRCPKGKHCNFLHVFPNPGREFRHADEDHHLGRGQHDSRRSWREFSERRGSVSARSWRHSSERLRSHSPSHRSLRRESRSRSRERSRRRSRVRSRSRSRSRRRKRSRSRSKERSSRREQDRVSRSNRGSSIGHSSRNENEKDQKDVKNGDSDSGQESSNTDDHTPNEEMVDGQKEFEASTGSCLNPDDGKDTVTGQQEEVVLTRSLRKSKSPSVKQWSRSRSRSKSRSPHTSSHHKHKRSHSHRRHRKKKKKKRRKRAEDEEDSRDKSSSGSGSEQEEVDSCDTVLDSVSTQET
ncbi:uncharacterized protein LOC144883038 isoform X2 [Branchiostoma floridae x Branchiostoma japonicum]